MANKTVSLSEAAKAMAKVIDYTQGDGSVGGTADLAYMATHPTYVGSVERAAAIKPLDTSTTDTQVGSTKPSTAQSVVQQVANKAKSAYNYFSDTPETPVASRFDIPVKNEVIKQSSFGKQAEDVTNMVDAGVIDALNNTKNLPQTAMAGNAGLKAYGAKNKTDAVAETYKTMIEEASRYPRGYVYNGHTKEEWEKLLNDYSKSEYEKQKDIATKYADKAQEVGVWSARAKKESDIIKEAIMDDSATAQWFGDLAYSAGQQLPSMAAGALTAGVGTALGASAGIVQTAQSLASLGTMYGNVYNNTFNSLYATGQYDIADISNKATMDAMLEIGTEMIVGGTPGLGTGLLDSAEGVIYSKLAEPLAKKFAGQAVKATGAAALAAKAATYLASDGFKFLYDVLGEGVEEAVSEALSPFIDRMTIDPNAESATAEDIALAFAGGAITSAFFNVMALATNTANAEGKALIREADGTTTVKPVGELTQTDIDKVNASVDEVATTVSEIKKAQKTTLVDSSEMYARRSELGRMSNKDLRRIISELYSGGYIDKDTATSKMGKTKLIRTIMEAEGLKEARTAETTGFAQPTTDVTDVDVTNAFSGLSNTQIKEIMTSLGISTKKLGKASKGKLISVILNSDKSKAVQAANSYREGLPTNAGVEVTSAKETTPPVVESAGTETTTTTEVDNASEYKRLKSLLTVLDINELRRIGESFAQKGYIALPKNFSSIGNKFTIIDTILNHGNGIPSEAINHIEMVSEITSTFIGMQDEPAGTTSEGEPNAGVSAPEEITQEGADESLGHVSIDDPDVGYKVNAINLYVAAMGAITGRGMTESQARLLNAEDLTGKALRPQFFPEYIPQITDRLTVDEIQEWFNNDVVPCFIAQEDWFGRNGYSPNMGNDFYEKSVRVADETGKYIGVYTEEEYIAHFLSDVYGIDIYNNPGVIPLEEYVDARNAFEKLIKKQREAQDNFIDSLKERLAKLGIDVYFDDENVMYIGAAGDTSVTKYSDPINRMVYHFYEKLVTGGLTSSDLTSIGYTETFANKFMDAYRNSTHIAPYYFGSDIVKAVISTNHGLLSNDSSTRLSIRLMLSDAISEAGPIDGDFVSFRLNGVGIGDSYLNQVASVINSYVEAHKLKGQCLTEPILDAAVSSVMGSIGTFDGTRIKDLLHNISAGEMTLDELQSAITGVELTNDDVSEINRILSGERYITLYKINNCVRSAEGRELKPIASRLRLNRKWHAVRSSMATTISHEIMHIARNFNKEERARFDSILTKAMEATGKTREDFRPSILLMYGKNISEATIIEETDASFIETIISDPETVIQIAENGNPLISGFIAYIVNAVDLNGVEDLMTREEIRIAKELRANEKRGKANARRKSAGLEPIVAPSVDIAPVETSGTTVEVSPVVTVVADTAEYKEQGKSKESEIGKPKRNVKKIKLDVSLVQYPVGNSGKLVKVLTQDAAGNDIIAFKFHGKITDEQIAWVNNKGAKLDSAFAQSRWDKIYTVPFSQQIWDETGNSGNDTLDTLKDANKKSKDTSATFAPKESDTVDKGAKPTEESDTVDKGAKPTEEVTTDEKGSADSEDDVDSTDIVPGILKVTDKIRVYYDDGNGGSVSTEYPAELYEDFMKGVKEQSKRKTPDPDDTITMIEVVRTGDILFDDGYEIDNKLEELSTRFNVVEQNKLTTPEEQIENNPFITLTDDMFDQAFIQEEEESEEIRQWEYAAEKNGTYANGTPKSVADGTKVSRAMDNPAFTEGVSQQLDDERKKQILRDINLSYVPIGNSKIENFAINFWKNSDFTDSNGRLDISGAVNAFHISATDGTVSPEKIARGGVLLAEIRDMSLRGELSNTELLLADQLMSDFAIMSVISGRTLQFFRHLAKMTGDGRTYYINQMIKQLQNELHHDTALFRRKAASALDDYTIPEALDKLLKDPTDMTAFESAVFDPRNKKNNEALRNQFTDPNTTFEQKIEIVEEGIKNDLAYHIPPTLGSRLSAWRIFSMLGNVRTDVRNVSSNIAMGVERGIKDIESGLIEDLTYAATGKADRTRNTTLFGVSTEIKQMAADMWEKNARNVEAGGKLSFNADVRRRARSFGDSMFGKAAEGFKDISSNALEWGDAIFLGLTFRDAFAKYAAANAVKWGTTKEDVHKFLASDTLMAQQRLNETIAHATKEAQRATYREANNLAAWLNNQSRKSSLASLLIEGIIPFKRTPINVFLQGVRYSPVGILNGLKELTLDYRSGKIGPERVVYNADGTVKATYEKTISDAIDDLTAGMTGTMVGAVGYFLAMLGIFKGGGTDDDRAEYYDQMLGRQKYSVTLFDTNYTLDWLTPSAMIFFAGVEYATLKREDKTLTKTEAINYAIDSFGTIADPFTNLSMLSGLTDAMSSYSDSSTDKLGKIVSSAAANYASQYIPTLAAQVARTLDGTRRTNYINKDVDMIGGQEAGKFVNRIKSKIPGLASTNEAYVDQWGREEQYSGEVLGVDLGKAGVFINQSITPWYSRKVNKTEVDDRITDIFAKTNDSQAIPSTPNSYYSFDGETYHLKPSEYTKAKKTVGQMSYVGVESAFNSAYFEDLTTEEQAEVLGDIYKYANSVARYDYAIDNNIFTEEELKNKKDPEETIKKAQEAGLTIGDYYIIKKLLSSQETKNDKRRVARDLGLTPPQKRMFGL